MAAIVLPSDLASYLGTDVDETRAEQVLFWAQQLCESVVSPLPAAAASVVLDVASRAFTNPTNAQQQTAGPYSVGLGGVRGGLWLTQANKAALRSLNGQGGAFTVDMTNPNAGPTGQGWGYTLAGWDQIP